MVHNCVNDELVYVSVVTFRKFSQNIVLDKYCVRQLLQIFINKCIVEVVFFLVARFVTIICIYASLCLN